MECIKLNPGSSCYRFIPDKLSIEAKEAYIQKIIDQIRPKLVRAFSIYLPFHINEHKRDMFLNQISSILPTRFTNHKSITREMLEKVKDFLPKSMNQDEIDSYMENTWHYLQIY